MEHLKRLRRLGLRIERPLLDRTGFDELVSLRNDRWRDDQHSVGLVDGCFLATWVSGRMRHAGDYSPLWPVQAEPAFEELLEVLDDIGVVRRHVNEILAMTETGTSTEYDRYPHEATISYKQISHDAVFAKLVDLGYATA